MYVNTGREWIESERDVPAERKEERKVDSGELGECRMESEPCIAFVCLLTWLASYVHGVLSTV